MARIKVVLTIDVGNVSTTAKHRKEWIESLLENYEVKSNNPLKYYDVTDFPTRVLDVAECGD